MESLIGKTIDNYRILEVIGRGGMGVVFKALDDNLDKIVALKMIDPFLAKDENFVRRFKTEAKALAKLENPYIVGVHALRNTEAGLFMVMEYVESRPLSHYLRDNGPFNLKDTVSVLKQLLDAIGHAHQVGVIHRDIKPSNILLCDNGKVKVTDFGLAKVVQQKDGASTVTQTRAGTLYYMSPEQIKGLKNVDIRSDLYSLGMTLYEMLTGRVPFDKTDSDFTIQRQIVDGEIPSPIKFNTEIPKKLSKIIQKAISKEPEKRYQTAGEMLDDILKFEKEILTETKTKKSVPKEKPKPALPKGDATKKYLKLISVFASFAILIAAGFLYFLLSSNGNEQVDSILSITTNPDNSEIIIDDVHIGNSPVEKYKVNNDKAINIKIKKTGYFTFDTSLTFQKGSNENLKINLIDIIEEVSVMETEPKEVATTTNYGSLKIMTKPEEASIFLNGKPSGSTPYENKMLAAGTYRVLIRKKGFLDINQSVKIVSDKVITVEKDLTPAVKLTINSDPADAVVIINDKPAGKTPYINNQTVIDDYNVIVKKSGFKTSSEKIKITDNKTDREINIKLEPLVAKVQILVRPFGSIYINEQLKVKDTNAPFNIDLPGGSHQLKIVHPTFGSAVRTINIVDDKPMKFNLDLSRIMKLTIISNPPNSEIFINDQSSQKYTPALLTFTPGSYKVQVKKDGYNFSPVEKTYNIGSEIYEESKDREERIEFKLEAVK
ncbi:MAG: serine/threonine protein kinase [Ignavibacterium sp.]|nr:serine/threonine protein kinase [Ignavibacterium sp.]